MIPGNEDSPKFRILDLCFKHKCAGSVAYNTQKPPDEISCQTDENNATECTASRFEAVGAKVCIINVPQTTIHRMHVLTEAKSCHLRPYLEKVPMLNRLRLAVWVSYVGFGFLIGKYPSGVFLPTMCIA